MDWTKIRHDLLTRMKVLGLTQRDLAARMGSSPAAVSLFLSRDNPPNLRTLERIAKALRADIEVRLVPYREI